MNVLTIAAAKILKTRTKRPTVGTKSGNVFDGFGADDDSLHDKQKK